MAICRGVDLPVGMRTHRADDMTDEMSGDLYFNIRNLPRKRARQSLREMLENMSVPKYSTLRRDLFRIFKPYRWKNESEKMASFISIMSYILKESI